MNCARRTGEASVEHREGQDVYWLPMTEANKEEPRPNAFQKVDFEAETPLKHLETPGKRMENGLKAYEKSLPRLKTP